MECLFLAGQWGRGKEHVKFIKTRPRRGECRLNSYSIDQASLTGAYLTQDIVEHAVWLCVILEKVLGLSEPIADFATLKIYL